MTKRDIVLRALSGQPVPYTPWSISLTHEARQKLLNHYGDVDLEEVLDNHFLMLGSAIGFFTDLGNNLFEDAFGVIWDRTVEKDIGNVVNQVLPEPDISLLSLPNPEDPRYYADIEERIAQFPDRFRMFCIGFSLYERAWSLRGMEDLMIDFIVNPDFVHDLLTAIADYNIALVRKASAYPIDAIYFGDDWGQQSGLQMGYKHWKTFIFPQLKRMYAAVREAGLKVVIHSCGDVDELFDDLVDIGLDCFNPFQPEVMDTAGLHQRHRGNLSFWGGLSTQCTLPNGSVDTVVSETETLIEMGRSGNYIFSPAHSVEGDVPLENLIAVIDTLKSQIPVS